MIKPIAPMTAESCELPFNKAGWIFERKFDGVRALTYLENGTVKIIGRSDKDITARYPEFHDIGKYLDCTDAVVDGEIVALNENGLPDFQQLQSRINVQNPTDIEALRKSQNLCYYIFDIMYLNGISLVKKPLHERKDIIEKVLLQPKHIKRSEYSIKNGIPLFETMKELEMEGIMAKNAMGTYQSKRSQDWLKIKITQREEVVICGFTAPRNSREYFGALVLGMYDNGKLQYVGNAGSGFTHKGLEEVYSMLAPNITKTPVLAERPRGEQVTWVTPRFLCEVKFQNWTEDMHMRMPIFCGLRDDKSPFQCILP